MFWLHFPPVALRWQQSPCVTAEKHYMCFISIFVSQSHVNESTDVDLMQQTCRMVRYHVMCALFATNNGTSINNTPTLISLHSILINTSDSLPSKKVVKASPEEATLTLKEDEDAGQEW